MEIPMKVLIAIVVSVIVLLIILGFSLYVQTSGKNVVSYLFNIPCYIQQLLGKNCHIEDEKCICE